MQIFHQKYCTFFVKKNTLINITELHPKVLCLTSGVQFHHGGVFLHISKISTLTKTPPADDQPGARVLRKINELIE